MSCAPYDLKCSVRYDSGNTQTYVMRTDVRVCQECETEKRERLRLTLQTGFFIRLNVGLTS